MNQFIKFPESSSSITEHRISLTGKAHLSSSIVGFGGRLPRGKQNGIWPLVFSALLLWGGIFLGGGKVCAGPGADQTLLPSASDRIDAVKAAFLLNIARFVSWPEATQGEHNDHFYLCLYRSNTLQPAIEDLSGRRGYRHPIEVLSIATLTEITACNMLFIGPSDLAAFQREAEAGPNHPVLTIADLTDAASTPEQFVDVHVHLVPIESRIGFEINLDKIRRSGLWMSSKLLKLARIIGSSE